MTVSYSKANDHACRILAGMSPARRRAMAQMVPEAKELIFPPPRAVEDTDQPWALVDGHGDGDGDGGSVT